METLKIEQCDRDAAGDIWRDYVGRVGECIAENAIRSGASDDTMIVQAFARHRIAERERNAGIAEEGTQPGCDDPECSFNCLERRAIAQAIRAASDD